MARELIVSSAIPGPKFAYTPCVRIGSTVQVSGMVALDPATGDLLAGDTEVQATQILRNLTAALKDYGVGLEDLLIVRVYLVDLAEFAGFNRAWSAVFKDRPPARTTVGVSALPLGARVEMEFTFVT